MDGLKLTEDEKDVLQELMNVAYGSAAAATADMLGAFAALSIPKISVMNTDALLESFQALKGESFFFATQAFFGDFSGESAFFIDAQSTENLSKQLELESTEETMDALLEFTNILTSSLTSRLAQEMDTIVKFAIPNINEVNLENIQKDTTFKEYSQVIVIETEINFKDEKINGEIFILAKDDSIVWLKEKLNNILEMMI